MTTPTPLADALVAPLLLAARDCLAAELARSPAGPACRVMVAYGVVAPTMDGCACSCEPDSQGDAWVRLVQLEPDATFETLGSGGCPGVWQAVIELGTYRCVPVPEAEDVLTARQMTDTALLLAGDMAALLRVLDCCPTLRERNAVADLYVPIGPSGGCAGGALQIRVSLPWVAPACLPPGVT